MCFNVYKLMFVQFGMMTACIRQKFGTMFNDLDHHSSLQPHEVVRTFGMVDYVREMTAMKSCLYCRYGFCFFVCQLFFFCLFSVVMFCNSCKCCFC